MSYFHDTIQHFLEIIMYPRNLAPKSNILDFLWAVYLCNHSLELLRSLPAPIWHTIIISRSRAVFMICQRFRYDIGSLKHCNTVPESVPVYPIGSVPVCPICMFPLKCSFITNQLELHYHVSSLLFLLNALTSYKSRQDFILYHCFRSWLNLKP